MKTFVGVSGFSYPAWKGTFYPDDLKSDGFLQFYARQLGASKSTVPFMPPPIPLW